MTPEEKFKEMAMSAKDSIEDFNDFFDDQAIAWAYNEITTLLTQRNELVEALEKIATWYYGESDFPTTHQQVLLLNFSPK